MVDWKAIGGSGVGLAILTLVLLLNYDVTEMTYYCGSEPEMLRECEGGISGGLGTRCYDANQTSWDYCSSGWLRVLDYVEKVDYSELSTYLPENSSKILW